jgi:hypothetical protein
VVDFAWLADTTAGMTYTLGIPAQSLAIRLMSSVEGVDLNGGGSLGFHDAINSGTAANPILQPYMQGGYFSVNSAAVQGNYNGAGTAVLGHEIAEWLNDPAVDNIVPAWEDPTFAHICDNPYLEVGDPLEDVTRGFEHPQPVGRPILNAPHTRLAEADTFQLDMRVHAD